MTPIVDGLEERYGSAVAFLRLDAGDDGVGQRAFQASGLPGHPGYVLLSPDGAERWRGFGQQPASALEAAILAALEGR